MKIVLIATRSNSARTLVKYVVLGKYCTIEKIKTCSKELSAKGNLSASETCTFE